MNFSNNRDVDVINPPKITDEDVMNNMTAIGLNQQVLRLAQSMPSHIFNAWWKWLDDHGGDSNNNIIDNQTLAKYYEKEKLWNTGDSYAVVAKMDEDYTVVVHDKKPKSQSLLTNFIMLPMGAM